MTDPENQMVTEIANSGSEPSRGTVTSFAHTPGTHRDSSANRDPLQDDLSRDRTSKPLIEDQSETPMMLCKVPDTKDEGHDTSRNALVDQIVPQSELAGATCDVALSAIALLQDSGAESDSGGIDTDSPNAETQVEGNQGMIVAQSEDYITDETMDQSLDLSEKAESNTDDRERGSRENEGSIAMGHSAGNPPTPPHTKAVEGNSSDTESDSCTETGSKSTWVSTALEKAEEIFSRNYWDWTREKNSFRREIDDLTWKNDTLRKKNSLMKKHSYELEQKHRDVMAEVEKYKIHTAELKNGIARLSNALPQAHKDDRYLNSKFSKIFLSVEAWVLRHFLNSQTNLSSLQSLPPESKDWLTRLWGEKWIDIFLADTVHAVESIAISVIQERVFEPRLAGIVGECFSALEQYFGSSSPEETTRWRIRTTHMVISDKEFRSKLEKRAQEISEEIERLLGPFADPSSSRVPRMRRLRIMLEQAAELIIECNREPSNFSYSTYPNGAECQPMYMSDAYRSVADESLGEDGASVLFTVSPAVLRAPGNTDDPPIVVFKARVVRQVQRDVETRGAEIGEVEIRDVGTRGVETRNVEIGDKEIRDVGTGDVKNGGLEIGGGEIRDVETGDVQIGDIETGDYGDARHPGEGERDAIN